MNQTKRPSTSGPRMRCDTCGAIIQSKHRHDWVRCDCPTEDTHIFIDGGADYTRYGAGNRASWSWPDRAEEGR